MKREDIIDKLTPIFRNIFNDENIVLRENITADDIGSWDSLSHMLMIAEVENNFSIKFRLREISNLKNIGSLIELVEAKIAP